MIPIKIAAGSAPGTPMPPRGVPYFCGTIQVSETMLLDAGWRRENGTWIAPPSVIKQALKEIYE